MINIFETELQQKKSLRFALKQIYGINLSTSAFICKKLGMSANLKMIQISDEQIFKLVSLIESMNLNLSSDLKKLNSINFKKIVSIKLFRGLRKLSGLPVRGQRTHSNSKTAKLLNKQFKF
jgi:small subunit ribosomal protein S13